MTSKEELRAAFREAFGAEPRLFHAPGRVNLIGEHTDYNDGFVLPIALDRGALVAAAPRPGRHVRVGSRNAGETFEFDLDAPGPPRRGSWLDYVEGMAQALLEQGVPLVGADMLVDSDVPLGSGLSSSAALEIATGLALSSIAGEVPSALDLALAGQRAEHTYVGTQCGIMDQFIAVLGRADQALLIDCRALQSRHVPVETRGEWSLVLCDSGVRHELASSEYNARRAECAEGVALLAQERPEIKALRDIEPEDFEAMADRLPETVRRRCRHVVHENVRTLDAAQAFARGDAHEAGRLMVASHASLRDDYEVSCRELDVLVDIACSVPGVAGARMTGGGFGGCTVNLVRTGAVDEFAAAVAERYPAATGRTAQIYQAPPSEGARELTED